MLGGYDPSRYRVRAAAHATAEDGTRIPISLVYRETLPRGGRARCCSTGYGSYGIPHPVTFSSIAHRACSTAACVFAIAHVRGGGELGKRWHDDGPDAATR